MDAQLKKGILEMCILHDLEKESPYGYDMIRTMHSFFPEVTESTFYAILRRLYQEGDAEIFEGRGSRGPARKYYRITEQGRKRLSRLKADWEHLKRVVEEVMQIG
ncbi:MAG: PadR family transcriptional regulator [Lachnospiraceae bacterium]|nr:PadR family transcriptional regulator [Lachnospiraceae bacterium]